MIDMTLYLTRSGLPNIVAILVLAMLPLTALTL
jgi:hypothetical protein